MENLDLGSVKSFVDTLWVIDCAILVFIMQAGFMCVWRQVFQDIKTVLTLH